MKHDWEYKKLGEMFQTSSGGTPSKNHDEYYEGGNIPWLRSGEVSQGDIYESEMFITQKGLDNSSAKIFPCNTVVIAMYGATVGQVGILRNEMSTNQAICGIFPSVSYKPEFLKFVLYAQKSNYLKVAVGGAQPNISQQIIKDTLIPNIPLPTQQSIVSELDSLSQIIADCKETLKDYDALEQSIFYDMFGDPVKNDKGWEVRLMKDVAPNVKYQKEIESFDGKFWLLNLDMIQQQTGEIIDYIYEELESIGNSTTAFSQEYVLYSKLRPYLNKVVLPIKSGYCTSELIPLLPDSKCLNKYYLAHLLRHKSFVEFINIKVAGAKMPRVSMNDFWGFSVILPPLPLQQQFASKIEAIEKMKSETKKALQEAETLFNARMDYWFN